MALSAGSAGSFFQQERGGFLMRKALFAGAAVFVFASGAAIAQFQPLNVKTGQWEITVTSAINMTLPPEAQAAMARLPPAQQEALRSRFGGKPQTRTFKSCITQADLAKGPFQDPSQNCNWSVVTSTSSDVQMHGTICRSGDQKNDMTGDFSVEIHVIDSENSTGTVQINGAGNGQTIASNATLTGKWLGSTCEAK
jgi:hypothetical protein